MILMFSVIMQTKTDYVIRFQAALLHNDAIDLVQLVELSQLAIKKTQIIMPALVISSGKL